MKKLIFAALVCSLGFTGCNDRKPGTDDVTQDSGQDSQSTAADTTALDSNGVATPPIDNPEPGVEKSGGGEQVP